MSKSRYLLLAEKYEERLRQISAANEYTPGRRILSKLLSEWENTHVTEYTAMKVMLHLALPQGSKTGRTLHLARIDDHSPNPLERELSVKGVSIKTLDDLLAAAEVDLNEWSVLSWKCNSWEQATRTKVGIQKTTLYQVKANLERRLEATYRPAEPARCIPKIDHPARTSQLKHAVIIPDLQMGFQWKNRYQYLEPMHDREALDAVIALVREIKPHYVILLGDMMDLAPWTLKFPKNPEYKQTTQPVIDELHWWLAELRSSAPGAEIVYMAGNHEERMHKALVDRLPEATYLAQAFKEDPVLSIKNLLRLDDLHISYVGPYGTDWWLWDRVRITHGTKVRSGGGATAAAIAKTARWSEVYGHVHKVELMQKTFHGPLGRNVITAMSPGCLCRVDGTVPGVNLNPDWQQGVGIATLDEQTELVHMQVLPIHDGSLVWDGRVIEGQDSSEIAERIAFETGWKQLTGE